ncbi:MAG: hypothetical protein OHK93_006935 [Ramalina farinacea]|uniref:Uncharacterized protein n=1 Tax=Ramalina farinacea TaxID=258253 RepID=A0AA43TTY7_9LECA|nr:hypothetical protein [Ramalina farinacea]
MIWFGYKTLRLGFNTLDNPKEMRCTKPGQYVIAYVRESYSKMYDKTGQDKVGNMLWVAASPHRANAVDVVVDTAANTNQLRHTLSNAGEIAGILSILRTHDVRRGAARDLARIPDIKGFATPMTAKVLGHTTAAYNNGTTDGYVGAAQDDIYLKRVAEAHTRQMAGRWCAIADLRLS